MASIGDSVSERPFRKDAADGDGLSSEGKGFWVSLFICQKEVSHMF